MVGMTTPDPIDMSTWARREHFENYMHTVPCTYALTVEMDATVFAAAMSRSLRKTYIAQIWALTSVVNRHDEFKMCLLPDGQPAVWPTVQPSFTVFNPDRETFSNVWTPYDPTFSVFHEAAADLLERHRSADRLYPLGDKPANAVDISSLPWASFTGLNLNAPSNSTHMSPNFTLGKYRQSEGKLYLPLAVQMHHAAADGFHTARLINEFQDMLADPSWIS